MASVIFLTALFVLIFSILLSYCINKLVIKITLKKHYGQIERKYLYFHNSKKNTPILGGLSIVITISLSYLIYSLIFSFDYIVLISIISLLLFGLVGFLDDFKKIKKKNSDGISPLIRLFLEAIISLVIISLLGFDYDIFSSLNINGIKIGLFSFPLFIFDFNSVSTFKRLLSCISKSLLIL